MIAFELSMPGVGSWNGGDGLWVKYSEVEKAVAEIVMASLEENDD